MKKMWDYCCSNVTQLNLFVVSEVWRLALKTDGIFTVCVNLSFFLIFSNVTVAWHKCTTLITSSNTHTKLLHFSEGDTSHIQLIMSHLQDASRLSLNHIAVMSPKVSLMPAQHRVALGNAENKITILQHYWCMHIYSVTI